MSIRPRHSNVAPQPLTIKTNLNVSDIHARSNHPNALWSPAAKYSQTQSQPHAYSQSGSRDHDRAHGYARIQAHPYHPTHQDLSAKIASKPSSRRSGSAPGLAPVLTSAPTSGRRDRPLKPLFTSMTLVKPPQSLTQPQDQIQAPPSPSPTGDRPRPSRIIAPPPATISTPSTIIPIPIHQYDPEVDDEIIIDSSPISTRTSDQTHQSPSVRKHRAVPEPTRVPARSRFPAPANGRNVMNADRAGEVKVYEDREASKWKVNIWGGSTKVEEADEPDQVPAGIVEHMEEVDFEAEGGDKSHLIYQPPKSLSSIIPANESTRTARPHPLARRGSSLYHTQTTSSRSSSRVIRASREGTPTGKSSARRTGSARSSRTIYAVVGKGRVGSERTSKVNESDTGLEDVEPRSAALKSPVKSRRTKLKPDPEDNDFEDEANDDEPLCWTCHANRPTGRNVNPRGYDDPDQEYRQLSRELQKALPGLAPCRKCLPDKAKLDARDRHRGRGSGNTSRRDSQSTGKQDEQPLCLLDVEAALILSYLERDERLLSEYQAGDHKGKYMFLADKEDFSHLMVERALAEKGLLEADRVPLSAKAVASGGVGALGMTVKRKDGVVRQLSKGVCGNCGTDETGAIMWRTDQVVKEQFGLKRKLCNKCGLYKQTNLVDRPILHPWSTAHITPANSTRTNTPANRPITLPPLTDVTQASSNGAKRNKRPRMDTVMEGRLRRDSIVSVASRSSAGTSNDSRKSRHIRREEGAKRARMENGPDDSARDVVGEVAEGPCRPLQLQMRVSPRGNLTPTYALQPVHGMPQGLVIVSAMTPISGSHGHLGYQWTSPGQMAVGGYHLASGGYQVDQIPSPPISPSP